jgi:hypothetical protein
MAKYWIKILVGALLIFGVGFTLFATGRRVVGEIKSDHDLTIPLGNFIGFNLNGEKLGTLRSFTIKRTAPHQLSGFGIRVRLADTIGVARIQNCMVSVTDPEHIDDKTMFFCLKSDSGYTTFGEFRADLRMGDGNVSSTVLPLYLPNQVVQDILSKQGGNTVMNDSMAIQVRERVRMQSRAIEDSIRAVTLEQNAKKMQAQADSIRARANRPPPKP